MKKIYLTVLVFCISSHVISQCGWSYTNTASNATIALLDVNFEDFTINYGLIQPIETAISDLSCSVALGVFFNDDNGNLVCGGYVNWDNSASMALSAWGDDPTTSEKDGFDPGEDFIFKLCVDGVVYDQQELVMSTEFSTTYTTNGLSSISSINFNAMGFSGLCGSESSWDCVDNECIELSTSFGPFLTQQDCENSLCESIDLIQWVEKKDLLKQIDLYGREISNMNNNGFVISIYSDQTISKSYEF